MGKGYGDVMTEICGSTSDGNHTLDELYEHRRALFLALAAVCEGAWRSRKHDDGYSIDGWFIAGISLPTGNISYHLPDEDWEFLDGALTMDVAREWDGHTSADVVFRLREYASGEN